jgi:hypothetical protein
VVLLYSKLEEKLLHDIKLESTVGGAFLFRTPRGNVKKESAGELLPKLL